MTSRQRVIKTIHHEVPDKVPLDLWIGRPPLEAAIANKYGTLEAFYDAMGTDVYNAYTHSLASPVIFPRKEKERIPYEKLKRMDFVSPDDERIYSPHVHSKFPIKECVQIYKHRKEKAVFGHVWGVTETIAGLLGIENMLLTMATDPEGMKDLFRRSAKWSAEVASTIMEMGIDVLKISDDWGTNNAMLFSPRSWWEMVYPAEKILVDAAKKRGIPVFLHSCGYITDIIPGIIDLGIDILHPIQESAGMDQAQIKRDFGKKLCLYGGLDVSHVLPRGSEADIIAQVKEKMTMLKPDGGYIFCTSHSVQEDTSVEPDKDRTLERVELAYKIANELRDY